MTGLMPDSQLNGAERGLQHSLRNASIFNGLLMACAVTAAFVPIHALPDRRPIPAAKVEVTYRPAKLAPVEGPLQLAGAWEVSARDRRFGGLSALVIDQGRFLAVSDL